MSELAFLIPDELVEAIAARVAAILADRAPAVELSPYLNVAETAEYLRCSRQRIYDLCSAGRLTRVKDGERTLIARAELERYLAVDTPPPTPLPMRSRGATG